MIVTVITRNNHIFDAFKTVLPLIATLIIGYYFGEKYRGALKIRMR